MPTAISKFVKPSLYTILVIAQLSFVILLYLKPVTVAILVIGLLFLAITLSDVKWSFYILLFILLVAPPHGYSYSPLNFSFNLKALYLMIVVILFFFLIEIITRRKNFSKVSMKLPMVFFASYVILAAIIGALSGNRGDLVRRDFVTLSLFGLYFFIPTIVNTRKGLFDILKIFVIGTIIITIEYYIIFIHHLITGTFVRINAIQGQIFLFSVPLIIGMIITTDMSKIKRFISICLITLSLGSIAITFARSLWFSLLIGILIMFFLFRKEINKKYLLGSLSLFLISFTIIFVSLTKIIGLDIWTYIVARAATLLELTEVTTFQQRLLANQIVLDEIIKNPIFGYGLGREATYSFIGTSFTLHWIDNSYYMLLWKLGIIGTVPFLWIIVKTLKKSINIFEKTRNKKIKVFIGAMISFIISWLIFSTTTPSLIKYLTNIIWITLIALANMVADKRTTQIELQ